MKQSLGDEQLILVFASHGVPAGGRARAQIYKLFENLQTFPNIDLNSLRGVTLPTLEHCNHSQVISLLKSHPFVTQRKETNE